jgi:hypothetical protein
LGKIKNLTSNNKEEIVDVDSISNFKTYYFSNSTYNHAVPIFVTFNTNNKNEQ